MKISMRHNFFRLAVASSLTLLSLSATAIPFTQVRIGDQDGFGYGAASGLVAADGLAANRSGGSVLDQHDFLPDLNHNGTVAKASGDDFDNRSSEGYSCSGCTTNAGMAGVDFTDISLSQSYDAASGNSNVYDANTGTRGAGGTFPGGTSSTLSNNQPGFYFDFDVASGDITSSTTLYFNLIFGDYDVTPATIRLTRADGTTFTVNLNVQQSDQDGLIQAAYAQLNFSDIFTGITGGYNGRLGVDFVAPNEPYTAFDFAELSTTRIGANPNTVPEPGVLGLMCIGILGIWLARQRKV